MATALITGASGGLGEEFAKLCAQDGNDLVLVARNKEKLTALGESLAKAYGIRATVIAADLSIAGGVRTIVDELNAKNCSVDILINNAGFGAYGLFAETDFTQEKSLIAVNIAALTELTKALLPPMVQRGSGKILNVASSAAFLPGPLMAVYYASKGYVMQLSVALSVELKGSGVTVTCLCPGPTATGFETHAHMEQSKLFHWGTMDAMTVAEIGYAAMKRGKPLVVSGLRNKVGAFLTRFASRPFAARMAKIAQSPS